MSPEKAQLTPDMANISAVAPDRLARYIPAELGVDSPWASQGIGALTAMVHLAAARYTISTYLPRRIVHQALVEGRANPWLQWVEGSLLFADLSGSTALAERLSALGREGTELVTDFLNSIFARMIDVIQQYGGDLVSFGGDALLVLFDDEAHSQTAARAALALQDVLNGYVRRVAGVGEFPMHLHVGVESGQVALVSAGRTDSLHYAVLGAAVNGVAHAEALAGPGEVVLGRRAYQLATAARGDLLEDGLFRLIAIDAASAPVDTRSDDLLVGDVMTATATRLVDDLDRISPYLPTALLARIVAAPEQPQVEADLRPVTALFAQVVGLEMLAEVLPAEQAALAFESYVVAMQAAIERYGGGVNKLDVAEEGVKLLAIFGAPTAYEDHAERGARAALAMQAALSEVNLVIEALLHEGDLDPPAHSTAPVAFLRQRIGLNPGVVFAGNVGSAARKEYTVMGDAVNVAARVMNAAGWGEVWCSAALATAAARMVCAPQGVATLKGKSAPLELCRVDGERDEHNAGMSPRETFMPLIGRRDELAQLAAELEAAIGGAGRTVRLVGEAGVGKSRLVAALIEQARQRRVRVVSATCFSFTASIPYAAWGELLKSLCSLAAGESSEVRAAKIAEHLAALGPDMAEWLPLLGDLVRLDVPDNRLTRGLDPQLRQERRFDLIERLLVHAAAASPLLVVFEDLHWVDPISLDLWHHVAQNVAAHPILLLGVHRPAPVLGGDDCATVLDLRELPATDSDRMVEMLAGEVSLPETLRRQIAARAAGNPLFLAELLRAVLDRLSADRAALNSVDSLPDSLNGLLLARIDRLDEQARGVLRVASVIGQRIPFGVLHAVQASDRVALLRQLVHLDEEEITLLERTEPERVHMFRHALLQEVAYQSMLYARRRELHGRIGEYLEQRYGTDLDDYYGLLAHHYRLSDRRDKAIDYLLKAGHAARAVFANDEALQYYHWALEALAGVATDPRAWEAREAIAEVEATLGHYDEALAQHDAVLAVRDIPPLVAQEAYRRRGAVLEKQGKYAAALEELERALAIGRAAGAPLAVSLISADIALVRRRRGEYDLALAACETGLAALKRDPRTTDDERIEARLHAESGSVLTLRGDYAGAMEFFARSLQVREALDDLPGMIASHNNLGYLHTLQSAYERALEHYRVAEELARKIDLRYAIVYALGNIAYALTVLGQYREAEAQCREALELSRRLNAQQTTAQLLNTLGIIHYRRGDYPQAQTVYDEALQLHQALGSTDQEANTLVHLAQTYSALGDFPRAIEFAGRALETAEALQAPPLQVEALNAVAEALLGAGDPALAVEHADLAVTLSRDLGADDLTAIALRQRGEAIALLNDTDEWIADLTGSAALCEAVQDRFELARTWRAHGMMLKRAGNFAEATAYLKQAYDTFMVLGAAGELRRMQGVA